MNAINILIIVIIAIILMHCCNTFNNEPFTTSHTDLSNPHVSFGRRAESGLSLLDDSAFSGVHVFENDDDPYASDGKLGLEKCLEHCKGRCMEFGVTGIGWCFPPDQ